MSPQTPNEIERLDAAGFARLLGLPDAKALPPECLPLIERYDFRYRPMHEFEQELQARQVLQAIDAGNFTTAGPKGKARWEKGWGENLARFKAGDTDALVPKYIRPNQPVRLFGRYVVPLDSEFERHWYDVFQEWLFRSYFQGARTVYEFGCGSGINLARLAAMYPDKRYVGLDWAQASAEIADELGRRNGWSMRGRVFDFFHPDPGLVIESDAAVLTVGALEQTGSGWLGFMDFLMEARPSVCVHVEPIVEWYKPDTWLDKAAIRFHDARGYWRGFPAWLYQRKQSGSIKVLRERRAGFGSLYIEGYSQVVWAPR